MKPEFKVGDSITWPSVYGNNTAQIVGENKTQWLCTDGVRIRKRDGLLSGLSSDKFHQVFAELVNKEDLK